MNVFGRNMTEQSSIKMSNQMSIGMLFLFSSEMGKYFKCILEIKGLRNCLKYFEL